MGFFSKIKDNINHGGVDVRVQAPVTVSKQDPVIKVQVFITSKNETRAVNSVSVELVREHQERSSSFNSGFNNDNNSNFNNNDQTQTIRDTLASAEVSQPFTLIAGQPQTLNVDLVNNQQPGVDPLNAITDKMGVLGDMIEKMASNNVRYYITASADVEGISLDPSGDVVIQMSDTPPTTTSGGVSGTL